MNVPGRYSILDDKIATQSRNPLKKMLSFAKKHPVLTTISATVATGGVGYVAAPAIAAGLGSAGLLGATASGKAISDLSGAALINASLAKIGGGAIASGGSGVAGGKAVIATTSAAAGGAGAGVATLNNE